MENNLKNQQSIYVIMDLTADKAYYGSTLNPEVRFKRHNRDLENGKVSIEGKIYDRQQTVANIYNISASVVFDRLNSAKWPTWFRL